MTLFPARVLPVNDAHGGPYLIRVDMYDTHASIYVRRDSDKKTWSCKVSSIQEILAPTQQARALDLIAVITCLYHGVGYDSASLHGPFELTRREVAFAQPETWTDGNYRLTTRISMRSVTTTLATATPTAVVPTDATPDALVPVVEIEDEDVVFGLNFAPSSANIEQPPIDGAGNERMSACLRLISTTFPNTYLNWAPSPNRDFVRAVRDGVYIAYSKNALDIEVTLGLVHTKGPVLCVLSFGSHLVKPSKTTTFQPTPHSDIFHTDVLFENVRVEPKGVLQVTVLPGSACVLGGTTLALRELGKVYISSAGRP